MPSQTSSQGSDGEEVGALPAAQARAATPSEPSQQVVSGIAGIPSAWRFEPLNITPLAWAEVYSEAGPIICFDESERVVDVVACAFGKTVEERDERAALIAAAPELLALCEEMVSCLDEKMVEAHDSGGLAALGITHSDEGCTLCKARRIISKALGQHLGGEGL
jgi:hypothetical protein